jgi:hypothetical protein
MEMRIAYTLLLTLIYAVTVFSGSSFATEKKAPKKTVVQRAFEVFPPSLESDYQGIVESTIYNVILLKKYYPNENYSKFISKLNEIAEENTDPALRYKAHLASIYLTFSDMIEIQPKEHAFEREYLFKQITDQIENKLAVK